MTTSRPDADGDPSPLEVHFRRHSKLNRSLGRWQSQGPCRKHRPGSGKRSCRRCRSRLSLQECGLAISYSRSAEGLYAATLLHDDGASIESGYCATPMEACVLVLGLLNPEQW